MDERDQAPTPPRRVRRWPTFALGQLYRSAHARISADLADMHESLSTYYVLATLAEYGELSQQQVCDRIEMDRSDMVRLVDDLEARGKVVRARDHDDRRRYRLTLTPEGTNALHRCERALAAATDVVFANLAADERHTLHRLTLRALGDTDDVVQRENLSNKLSNEPRRVGTDDAGRGGVDRTADLHERGRRQTRADRRRPDPGGS